MDNITRRQLLDRHRRSGFPGSIIDVYKAHEQGIDLIGQFEQQQMLQKQNIDVASTPQEVQQGLRPAHAAGDVNKSMLFPNIPPNTPFNTVGIKAPINIQKFDNQGHLVKSYENVPPGIKNLPMGPHQGTVLETPAQMQSGGEYNMNRALELGYTADKTGHWPSVDYTNGMWLKSSQHPTAIKEFLHGYLDGDHYKTHNIVTNTQGYFGENQLQYVPKQEMKSGGVRKAQNGLPPYYASSKNDPRYIAYSDSLNLHLATLEQDRLMGSERDEPIDNIDYWTPEQLQDARVPKYNPILGYDIAKDYQSQEHQFQDEDGDGKIDYNDTARREDEQLINYYKSLGFTDDNIMYHSSPDLVHPTIKPSYTYFDGTAYSPYYVAPKQEVILNSKLPSIQPKQISTSIQAPELQIPKIPTYLESTPIYQQDSSVSTGQYQIGENMWDPNKKQWFRSIFDKEMQGTFRQNAIPRKEKWRTIETPPGGFMNGGVRKAQNGLPPTVGKTSPDWKPIGTGLRIGDTIYQDSELTGSTRIPLNPETGDALPIMLPEAEVVGRQDYDDSIKEAVSRTNAGVLGRASASEMASYLMSPKKLAEAKFATNMVGEISGALPMERTLDRIQNNPSELFTLEGGLDAMPLFSGVGALGLGIRGALKANKVAKPISNIDLTKGPLSPQQIWKTKAYSFLREGPLWTENTIDDILVGIKRDEISRIKHNTQQNAKLNLEIENYFKALDELYNPKYPGKLTEYTEPTEMYIKGQKYRNIYEDLDGVPKYNLNQSGGVKKYFK